ncbi:growth hormone-regulated TBC protein 1 isoform X2 [Saimiri boliviensis]|uniref:growth hormone-regulated TBC protein 1 isoform X2 n=1 Tax=Saimiri boliviensis TaxID=27679 RepID=UPI003D789015
MAGGLVPRKEEAGRDASRTLQWPREVSSVLSAQLCPFLRGVLAHSVSFCFGSSSLRKQPKILCAFLSTCHPGSPRRVTSARREVRDLNRTFPDNVKFRKTTEPCLQETLYNVLLAYGHHNQAVGFCQGMNFIAGYLILITNNEEESFWLLDALVGRILPDYYTPAMLGLKTDQEVLGELVRAKLPAVGALMEQLGVLWTLVVSRWFICLFVDVLPVETVLRIWDCLFNEGSKIIFRVALTLIKQHQEFILEATSIPDICDKFKQITKGSFVMECHTFMQKIFSEPGSLSMATVAKLRESCRARLLAQG